MKLTKENIIGLNPCCQGFVFAEECNFDAVKIWAACPRGEWLVWLLRKTRATDKYMFTKLACQFAGHVLSIYESKYPVDKRPRMAIESAKAWADNPTDEKLALASLAAKGAREAQRAAASDANTVAAAAAEAAVDAAVAAVDADADAAAKYAADAAACGVFAAASDAAECKWQADSVRQLIPCPFE